MTSTTYLKNIIPKAIQPKRSQAYYDTLAHELKNGATYINEKTGNIIHTYGLGNNDYCVQLYKMQPGKSAEDVVKNGKVFYELNNDSWRGLYEYDRYVKHGVQEDNYLTTHNAQRRFWNGSYWTIKEGNPYVRFLTTYKNNAHSLFGKCVD